MEFHGCSFQRVVVFVGNTLGVSGLGGLCFFSSRRDTTDGSLGVRTVSMEERLWVIMGIREMTARLALSLLYIYIYTYLGRLG